MRRTTGVQDVCAVALSLSVVGAWCGGVGVVWGVRCCVWRCVWCVAFLNGSLAVQTVEAGPQAGKLAKAFFFFFVCGVL